MTLTFRRLALALLLLGVFGCSYPIAKEYRQEARKDLTFPQVLQNPNAYIGSTVIWGGSIIQTNNRRDGTEIVVLQTPLESLEKPEGTRYSQGRFIVRSPQFLDPEIYKNGKRITVAGDIAGVESKPLGNVQYAYPVLDAKQIHLWSDQAYAPPPPYYYYDWYGWGPWWPYGWGW